MAVPPLRRSVLVDEPPSASGSFVLYWMSSARRLEHNYALERAVEWAQELKQPLVILEALRVGYAWASDRFHRFVLDGMREHAAALTTGPVHYYPYVEERAGAGKGLVAALSEKASVVVGDEWPCFFLPQAVGAAARRSPVRFELIDGSGLLPLRAADRCFTMAMHFRGWLKKNLLLHLEAPPAPRPLEALDGKRRALPALSAIQARWPAASEQMLAGEALASLPIDHRVGVVATRGGRTEARARLDRFLAQGLKRYAEGRNDPDVQVSSALSAHLHFGHISAHEVAAELWGRGGPARLFKESEERWGLSKNAAEYFDQLVVWRELGLNFCHHRRAYDRYESLPEWAQTTLERHQKDPRPSTYELETLEAARTHDPIWNAAQRQLMAEGIIHNHLRMLWGKKVLEWSPRPQDALAILIHLNNKYAIDGRDPNSYSGIFWTFGRYDRPWPERPIYGMVRSMSSERAAKKLDLDAYVRRWAGGQRDLFG